MPDEGEFPQLQAGSLRKGFVIIHDGQLKRIRRVDCGKITVMIMFENKSIWYFPNERQFEVVATKITKSTIERKGYANGKRKSRTKRK